MDKYSLSILSVLVFVVFNSKSNADIVNVLEIKDNSYGSHIGSHTARSFIGCYIACTKTDTCKSVTYAVTSRVCSLNQGTIPTGLVTCTSGTCLGLPDVKYVAKPAVPCTIRDGCSGDTDCTDTGTECRDGICKCSGGLHHDPNTCSCVTGCTTYGDTFQIENNIIVMFNNIEEWVLISKEVCLQRCVDATSYVCRLVEYASVGGYCRTQEVTSFESATFPELLTTMYTRDCALASP